jgi:dihydroorotase
MEEIRIPALLDAHVHLRQGRLLTAVAPYTERCCSAAVLMPNTDPPLDTPERLEAYQAEVRGHFKHCQPLWTFKLTEKTSLADVVHFKKLGCVAAKLYPEGVTTNSAGGISLDVLGNVGKGRDMPLDRTLQSLCDYSIVLSCHGELPGLFCLDREAGFLYHLGRIMHRFAALRVVLEHISTRKAAEFVTLRGYANRLAATITAHHLLLTLDDVLGDKLAPHHFCKPVAKRPDDREALWELVLQGHPNVFLGSDSAPHLRGDKECAAGCAGVFTAPVLPEVLFELFEQRQALDLIPRFTSQNAQRFYGLTPSERTITVLRHGWTVPKECAGVVPFRSGDVLSWRLVTPA